MVINKLTSNLSVSRFINCACWMPLGEPGELAPKDGSRYNSFFVILLHPFSFGSVHVTSSDPLADPTIDPNYLHSAGKLSSKALARMRVQSIISSGCRSFG